MSNPYFQRIVCLECGAEHAPDHRITRCTACGSAWLDARYDYAGVRERWKDGLHMRAHSLWRYSELLPIAAPDPAISMAEGMTPLIRLYQYETLFEHEHLYVKDERQGPTSSFKDRQAVLAVTAMKQAGVTECVLASTGNAAAAYAAYCARAGIKLWLFLTSLVPSEKMREAALYGAEVVKVSGTYDETKAVAAEFAQRRGVHLDGGAKAVPGKESMKTLGLEIAEGLGLALDGPGRWRAPDWYIQAVSGGIGPLGVWKGFTELHAMGLIDRLPKLGIVQAAGCAPMVQAFTQRLRVAQPVIPQTLITVLATGDPGFSYTQLYDAIGQAGGTMMAIEDGETFAAMRRVASKAGLSVEPATAVAFAGLEKMLVEGVIAPGETVVVNCSGHTFPAESHILGDQYVLNLELSDRTQAAAPRKPQEGLSAALEFLDEQVTTILVVDDNPNDRRLIRRLLKTYKSYRVFEARDGAEALRMVREDPPDLIVTDLTMPEMDGYTLIEQLKSTPSTARIPVVILSAKTLSDQDRQTLQRYSESVWLKGGFETSQLVDHIAYMVGDHSASTGETNSIPPRPRKAAGSSEDPRAVRTTTRLAIIIDDNVRDLRLTRRMIEGIGGFRVLETTSGREGLKAVYQHRPDLLVLDLMLPDIDGISLIRTLHNDPELREIPIVVYSGKHITPDEQTILSQSVRLFIEKATVDRNQFISMVSSALQGV
jgi:threonine synthase